MANDDELERCEWWSITADQHGYGVPTMFVTLPTAMGVIRYLKATSQYGGNRNYKLQKIERPSCLSEDPPWPTYREASWHIDSILVDNDKPK